MNHFPDIGNMPDSDHVVGGNKMVAAPFLNPNGIKSISPGLERSDYPGWPFIPVTTPTGLRQARRARGHDPFRVGDPCFTLTWRTESRWDSAARDLEQTIARNVAEILSA